MKTFNVLDPAQIPSAQAGFAAQFSLEDWNRLCLNAKFNQAVEAGLFDEADIIAWNELTARNDAEDLATIRSLMTAERNHAAAMELVAVWARKTGRTGAAGKQSRQGHIRKLMKHGLVSEYAKKMIAECGFAG